MPMAFGQMLRFEKLNDCKIKVFRYTEKQLVPLRVTRQKGDGLEIDLLLVDDGQEYHYILMLDLLRLVSMVKGTTTCCTFIHANVEKVSSEDPLEKG